jgi:tetratricopeptide (TPR) repeat protein
MVATTTANTTFTWYNVSAEVKTLLLKAAETWHDPAQADAYMQQALAQADHSMDVLISAYRYFFYRHNYAMAQAMAQQVLERVRREENLPADWPTLQTVLRQRRDEPPIRLYLTAYSALGYILARIGQLQAAETLATRLQTLDDNDEFGASLILTILNPEDDDDDD